jgi:hypothetical protein
MWCVRVCSNSVAATPLKSSSFAHQPLACTTAPSLWCALIATATSLRDYNRHRVQLATLTQCARSRYARPCHDYSQHTHPVRAHRSLSHPLTRTRRTHTYTRFRASFPGDEVLHVRELSEAATVSSDAGGAVVVDSVSSSTAHGWTPERRDMLLSELAALLVSACLSSRMMFRRCFERVVSCVCTCRTCRTCEATCTRLHDAPEHSFSLLEHTPSTLQPRPHA